MPSVSGDSWLFLWSKVGLNRLGWMFIVSAIALVVEIGVGGWAVAERRMAP